MVIINTKAVEVSIQAVSPELILSVPMSCGSVGAAAAASAGAPSAAAGAAVCAVGAAEAGVSSAHAAGMENVNRPSTTNRDNLVINANPLVVFRLRPRRVHLCGYGPLARDRRQRSFRSR